MRTRSGARSYLEGAYTRHLMDSPPASPLGLPEIDHNVVRAWQESSNVCPATDADFRSRLRLHAPSADRRVGMLWSSSGMAARRFARQRMLSARTDSA